jgi:hypothetical protein
MKTSMFKFAGLVWLWAALSSCSKPAYSPVDVNSFGVFTIGIDANPTNDFQRAIATNDTRFVAYKYRIAGSPSPGYLAPVVEPDDFRRYGVKVIAGTGRPLNAFPHAVATNYAIVYNQLLLQKLKAENSK